MSGKENNSYDVNLAYELFKASGLSVTVTKDTKKRLEEEKVVKEKEKQLNRKKEEEKNKQSVKPKKQNNSLPSKPKAKAKEKQRGSGTNVIASLNNSQHKSEEVKKRVQNSKVNADKYRNHQSSKLPSNDIISEIESEDSPPALCIEAKPTIPTEITTVVIAHGSREKRITIVGNDLYQDSSRGIYWKDRTTSKSILRAIFNGKSVVLHEGNKWDLISYTMTPELKKQLQQSDYVSENRNHVTVWIYKNKTPCPQHPYAVESITAYVPSVRYPDAKPININYCTICNKYYINSLQFNQYAKKYGMPLIRLKTMSSGEYADYSTWNDESLLHFLGYNVGSADNLSETERQRILREALEARIMTKAQAVSFIEGMINMHAYRNGMENAVYKWTRDMHYLQNYKIRTQEAVWADFKIHRK